MHIVNFCSYAIEELLSGFNAKFREKKPPQSKSRDQFLDETFMDWNLPEMDDEEYEKFVNQVDGFLRAWEKEYMKDRHNQPIQDKDYKPHVDDVLQHCSLDEIQDFLKDDPELTPEERFELYYDERQRRENKGFSLEEICKDLGIDRNKKS